VKASGLAADLLDLLLPRGCLGCRDRIPPEGPQGLVCARCRSLLRSPPSPRCGRCDLPLGTGQPPGEACLDCAGWPTILSSARAAVIMEPPADALVHALKYEGWKTLGESMGRRMAILPSGETGKGPVIPIPTTRRRQRHRGYNQALVLAEAVAREWNRPLLDALERPEGRTQVRLSPSERRSNVQGTFRFKESLRSRIRGRRVILVDDVLTTGATAISAAETLGEAGAKEVHILTFARALPFDDAPTGTRAGGPRV